MWKWTRKRVNKSVLPTQNAARSISSQESVQQVPRPQADLPEITQIGKLITIKGDVSGGGNVYVNGELESNVELLDGRLTVGSSGRIRANLQAPTIVVQGRVDGTCTAVSALS